MLSFIVSGLRQRFGILLVASLVPLAAFGGLIAVDQLLPSAAESDSADWLSLADAGVGAAAAGMSWLFMVGIGRIFGRSNGSKILLAGDCLYR